MGVKDGELPDVVEAAATKLALSEGEKRLIESRRFVAC